MWCVARQDGPGDTAHTGQSHRVDLGLITPEQLAERVSEAQEWCQHALHGHRSWQLWASYQGDYMGITGAGRMEFRTLSPEDHMLVMLAWA
jgi:hypothetical protein